MDEKAFRFIKKQSHINKEIFSRFDGVKECFYAVAADVNGLQKQIDNIDTVVDRHSTLLAMGVLIFAYQGWKLHRLSTKMKELEESREE